LPTRPPTKAPTEFISEAQLRIVGEKVVLRWGYFKNAYRDILIDVKHVEPTVTIVELVGKRLHRLEEKCQKISELMILRLLFLKLERKTRVYIDV
jgi:hypothetical protein